MKLIAETPVDSFVHGGTQMDVYAPEDVVDVACPLCGGERRRRIYTEHAVIGISRCEGCRLVYTSPRLKAPEEIYWGEGNLYFAEARLIFESHAAHHRDPNYRAELRRIERHRKSGRFLDVGCNMGMLLRLARERGWDVVGVEPSPSLAPLAQRWGFPVHNCFLHEVPATEHGSFDVVALSDVFEHITEPLAFLEQARRLAKPGGVLYVKVPNGLWSLLKQRLVTSLGRRPSRGLWDSYEHVVHYTERTLRVMLAKAGLQVLEVGVDPPVQTPNWHEHVGHYYQYPTPLFMDWKRKLVRRTFYALSGVERVLRLGSVGYFAPNLAAVARIP